MKYCYTTWFRILFLILLIFISYQQLAVAQENLPGSGKCLYLDGINDYLVAGKSNRGITNKVTIEAWVKTSSLSLSWVAGKYSNSLGEDAGYEFFVTNGYAALYGRDGSNTYRTSGPSSTFVADNKWHHIAGVVNNGIWEVWVDGNLENSFDSGYNNVDLTTQQANFCIGIYQGYTDTNFKGNIDEVRIWKTARTAEQLRANMCRKLTDADPNLVAYFKFDEINGNIFKDFSSSNSAGTLINGSSNNAVVTSGAPIGDESLATYQNAWGTTNLYIPGVANHLFEINTISGNTKGIHLYWVNSLPNSLDGISGSTLPNGYYGVYTISPNEPSTYTVNYTPEPRDKCLLLFGRDDNAQKIWSLLTTINQANTLVKDEEEYRGEYIFNSTNISLVTISGKEQICSGESTTLQAQAVGVSKFLWSTGETTATIQVNKPGTYSVKAFTTDQCFTENSLNVKDIPVSAIAITGDTVLCPGATTILQAAGTGFTRLLWNTGETTDRIQINSPGTYSVKAFTSEVCFSERTLVVRAVNLSPVTIAGQNKFCLGSSTELHANANGVTKFVWNTGESTPSILVKNPGTYSVRAYTTDHCYSEASMVVETIVENTPEIADAAGVSICPNNPATLVATGSNGSYEWYDAATGGNLVFEGKTYTTPTLTKTTTFYVQTKSNNVCKLATRTPVTVQVDGTFMANAGQDTTITIGSTIVLQGRGGERYHWEPATGLNNPNVERPVANPVKTTTYQLTTYTKDGCVGMDEVTITVLPRITLVNTFSPNHDDKNDLWEIPQIENYPGATVEIFNRWGAMIYKSEDGYKKPWDGTYQGKDLPLATYYYIIRLDKTSSPLSGSITIIR